MALWARAQQLPPEHLQKVRAIYNELFPLEVRHCLASWLESKIWANETVLQQSGFVEELVQEIHSNAELLMSPDSFVTKMKLMEAAKNLRLQYSHAPHDLYEYVKRCLAAEMEVIECVQNPYAEQVMQPERKYSELISGLHAVRQNVTLANEEIRAMQATIESFAINYHECLKHRSHLTYLTQTQTPPNREVENHLRIKIESLESTLNSLVLQIKQAQMVLVDRFKNNIDNLRELQTEVLDKELIRWKREQQLNGNGVRMTSNLDTIQNWCENLAELIWSTRQQVNNVTRINNNSMVELRQPHLVDILKEMSSQVTCLLSTLVTSTFVIEKQPPQVMKTNTRFTATVRLLVGNQLNVHMTPPRVTVNIISEQQAQQLLKNDSGSGLLKMPTECGDILNNNGTMEFQPANKQLSVSFRNMQLRKIKRAEKKGTESVMDEKLTLFFQSKFKVAGGELDFQVWTLSLPVVVIVHGNQEPHGWATVTWDNAFSQLERLPFVVPDTVTWAQLAETLCVKFKHQTQGDLTPDNLRFLAEKIFRGAIPMDAMTLNSKTVTWSLFCKDALPERNFTFWEWFYMVVKVTRDYLKALWCDRLIMGFIQKNRAEELLSKCPSGTFLLRFSDSELGGITIAWVAENEVFSLQPFTSRDLVLRSLADRVSDLTQLQFLYPNTPKDEVFSKYYSKPENDTLQKNGYVRPGLVTTLPAPFMGYAQSPDSHRNTPSVQSSYFHSMTPGTIADSLMDEGDLFDNIAFSADQFDNFDFTNSVSNASLE